MRHMTAARPDEMVYQLTQTCAHTRLAPGQTMTHKA
jgi:hypothetical protein